MEIKITVLGKPQPQPRHRHGQRGRFKGTYDPAKKAKADFVNGLLKQAPKKPFDKAVHIDIIFYFKRPKSHFGTGKNKNTLKLSAPAQHIVKPDIDNLLKFVCDSMNKVFWRDDSIICGVNTQKRYGDTAKTKMVVRMAD